jgi:hypothetical protein
MSHFGGIDVSSTPGRYEPNGPGKPDPSFDERVAAMRAWFESPRFEGILRLYSPRQVVEQQGTIRTDYTVARTAAEAFHARLRQLFAQRKQITTFGPYSPGQAVTMKRLGIEGIYLGGWATSAKGSITEDPGADLASYPLSQVPDEAAPVVRALLATSTSNARACPSSSARRIGSSISARSSSRMPTRDTVGTRMSAISSGGSSRWACPGITSRTRCRA